MKESNDPGRTRTYNPRLRGPVPYPLGHRTTWHGPASITSASRATSQWSETDKTQAGWFRHYKWSKEKVILFDGKNMLNHPALVLAMYRPWRPQFFKPPRPDRQRLGLSGISVCPELPAISAALAVGTQGFSAVTEWKSQMILVGLEPTIPSSVGRCLIHWATGPLGMGLHPSLQLLVQPASGLRPTKLRRDDLDTINEVRRR